MSGQRAGRWHAKGPDGISVFDAVEKQLGLKLDLQNVPMPSLVIESANQSQPPIPAGVATALSETPVRFEAASIKLANPDEQGVLGLRYTGGSQMRAGGTPRALIVQIPPNVAGDMLIVFRNLRIPSPSSSLPKCQALVKAP